MTTTLAPQSVDQTTPNPGPSPDLGKDDRSMLRRWVLDFHNRTVLFRRGEFIFTTYGIVVAVAFLCGGLAACWHDAATGQDAGMKAICYALIVAPAVLIGARACSILLEWRNLFRDPWGTIAKPGYMFHGGFFGGLAAVVGLAIVGDWEPLLVIDALALSVPLGEALARIGCFVYGCCWGRQTDAKIGVRYTSRHAKVVRMCPHLHGKKIHPVQLYATGIHLLQFGALVLLALNKGFDGQIGAVYLITHPPIRAMLERFRSDDRGRVGRWLTHTNIYSAIMAAVGVLVGVIGMGQGSVTVVDSAVSPFAVFMNPAVSISLTVVAFGCLAAFGIHRGTVGSWVAKRRPEANARCSADPEPALLPGASISAAPPAAVLGADDGMMIEPAMPDVAVAA